MAYNTKPTLFEVAGVKVKAGDAPYLGIPYSVDLGLSEKAGVGEKISNLRDSLGSVLGASSTGVNTQNQSNKDNAGTNQKDPNAGSKTPNKDKVTINTNKSIGGGAGTSGGKTAEQLAEEAAKKQEESAKKAAKEKQEAAYRGYKTATKAVDRSLNAAGREYDWIINTLGSNRDALKAQLDSSEQEQLGYYAETEEKTKKNYDSAKQEILTNYRDLKMEQEKVMRGMGMTSSSRSMEAQLKLSNLLSKDLGTLSTNEADSLALIGNAVTSLKKKTEEARTQLDVETKNKQDQAALQYYARIDQIQGQLDLAEDEKADRLAQAQTELYANLAGIETWLSNTKISIAQQFAKNSEALDTLTESLLDEAGGVTASVDEKAKAAESAMASMGYQITMEPTAQFQPRQIKAQKTYNSKEELDAALQNGEIDQTSYQTELANLERNQMGADSLPNVLSSVVPGMGMPVTPTNLSQPQGVQQDSLLKSLSGVIV